MTVSTPRFEIINNNLLPNIPTYRLIYSYFRNTVVILFSSQLQDGQEPLSHLCPSTDASNVDWPRHHALCTPVRRPLYEFTNTWPSCPNCMYPTEHRGLNSGLHCPEASVAGKGTKNGSDQPSFWMISAFVNRLFVASTTQTLVIQRRLFSHETRTMLDDRSLMQRWRDPETQVERNESLALRLDKREDNDRDKQNRPRLNQQTYQTAGVSVL
ncbi:uncharacterized protein TRIREDRAFT_111405 [Trichoderma reesei QM6a]|uniref:Predicted protein n=2 Tax=Hypocrea jecorina TaxID=51453 RepID=G0RUH3_HYPJQ|nr:uncharacterized protein TRIREDRAFT_111405 [Trichoderma reesei QM6a]EGR45194.1 predicted protein [Trichoderma reesei QM6a]ETR98307.1 hypothetical protein M419DRAFT_133559 [Trichoderma reesei RUT C-30]